MPEISVLYVDDEPINLMLFRSVFGKKYKVITAEMGESALDILKTNGPVDIVISDLRMPGMDGLEFITHAKTVNPEIPCFILTGYDVSPELQKHVSSGLLKNYFRKPLDLDEINNSISGALT
jgi:response regulator RpfG family c-di-GMP phosphodiesterase